MKNLLKTILAMAMLSFPLAAHAWDQKALNVTVDQTNFLVDNDCSGTLIGDPQYRYVLTAHHCIGTKYVTVQKKEIESDGTVKMKKVQIAKPGTVSQIYFKGPAEVQRNSYVYKVIADDEKLDLALLLVQTPLPNKQGAKLGCKAPERGDQVYAVGNAYVVLYSSVSKGMVSSVSRSYRDLGIAGELGDMTDNGEHGLIQSTALISPGNSGGALYNDQGEYIGTNVRGGGGWTFSVPYHDVRTFLEKEGHGNMFHCEKVNGETKD